MRKFLTLALVVGSLHGFAQRPEPKPLEPEVMAKKDVSELAEAVAIQFSVQDSLTTIFTKFYAGMKECMASRDTESIQKLEAEREAKTKAILSAEQYATYQKVMKKKKKERMAGPPSGGFKGEGGSGGRNRE